MYRSRSGLLTAVLDAVAPVRCAGCDVTGSPLCRRCLREVVALPQPRAGHVSIAFPYGGVVRAVLHRGKFRDARSALRILADVAAERLTPPAADSVVVPVPLSTRRQTVRGYNQATLFAEVVAGHHDLPLMTELVRRVRETVPQSTLGSAERRQNMEGAFTASPCVAGRTVWLLDDVRTTGATSDAAIVALERAGADVVEAAVLAAVL